MQCSLVFALQTAARMSNQNRTKKLTLTTETLRGLTAEELDSAVGGTWLWSMQSCWNCPINIHAPSEKGSCFGCAGAEDRPHKQQKQKQQK